MLAKKIVSDMILTCNNHRRILWVVFKLINKSAGYDF